MHTTLSPKWHLPALLVTVVLLAGCGVTTKKTFLDEPVQKTVGNAVPVSSNVSAPMSPDGLAQDPALNKADATGVQKLLNIVTPYRINIQQGNFISQEMLTRIQPGMTKEQVRFALGTPLLADVFHSARWDYLFRLQKPSGQVTNNRVVIYFDGNRVARIVHDPLPVEIQYLETIAGPAPKKKTTESGKKAAADEKSATKRTDADVSEKQPSVTPVLTGQGETTPAVTEAVTLQPAQEAYRPEHTVTDSKESTPVASPRETHRPEPVATETDEAPPARTETIEPISAPVERYQPAPARAVESAPGETTRPEKETVSTQTTMPAPAVAKAEPVRTETPTPVKQASPQKATTTTQDTAGGHEEDFRAAPNSTMQLHQLMQPQ